MHIYLASPYSHPSSNQRQWRYEMACEVAALLINQGYYVFSPIAHCHPIALTHSLPGDYAYWEPYNSSFLHRWATHLHVLQLPDWSKSIGVAEEIAVATRLALPISYISIELFMEWRQRHERKES